MLSFNIISLSFAKKCFIILWGLSISSPVLKRKGDFVLIFFTLRFCPYDFKIETDFTPALESPSNDVNFLDQMTTLPIRLYPCFILIFVLLPLF